jgi:hypothetical protein
MVDSGSGGKGLKVKKLASNDFQILILCFAVYSV